MIVVSPACSDERLSLRTGDACEVVNSIGTQSYGDVCFAMLERALNVEHWALFRFRSGSPLKCVATASKRDKAAARQNCDQFVGRCYSVDPSVKAASTRLSAPTLTKLAIDDIEDPQYRHCFELTHVQERVSLFSWIGRDLYQLSVFRGPRKASFSVLEMNHFAALAKLLLATAQKHEILLDQQTGFPRHLNVEGIERLLKLRSPELSTRECEVSRGGRQDHRRDVARSRYPADERHHLSPAGVSKARHLQDQRAGCAFEQSSCRALFGVLTIASPSSYARFGRGERKTPAFAHGCSSLTIYFNLRLTKPRYSSYSGA